MRRTSGKKVIKSAVGERVGERHEEIAAVHRKSMGDHTQTPREGRSEPGATLPGGVFFSRQQLPN